MKVKQFEPFIGMEEYEAIRSCFENNWITEGPKSEEFRELLCQKIGVKYGVFAPNGTLALYLGLRSMGIGPGDEVIVPDFTFIASATSVEMTGATPIFADINADDLQINVDDCHRLITSRTKAIMPAHLYGMTADMDEVMEFAEKYGIMVIEDAAQALGIRWKEKPCGSFGNVGCFSFFADKTITTGEGGFVVTDDSDTYDKLRYLRNQGRMSRGTFKHPEIGYNFRMTDIQAAIGICQIGKMESIIEAKSDIYNQYREELCDVGGAEIIGPKEGISPYIPFRIIMRTNSESSEGIMGHLDSRAIETRTFFYPLHKQPCFESIVENQEVDKLVNSVDAYNRGVCLPSYANLNKSQISYVCAAIREYYGSV